MQRPNSRHAQRKRWLVLLIITCQALCFGGILYLTLRWEESHVTRLFNQQHQLWLAHEGTHGVSKDQPPAIMQNEIRRALVPIRNFAIILTAMLALSAGVVSIWLINRGDWRSQQLRDDLEQALDFRSRELMRAHEAVILGLARLAEFRDYYTGQHLERIGRYTEIIALCLKDEESSDYPFITDTWIHDLKMASALHDIGKVGIPDHILFKPGKLTFEERAMIEDHPIIGGECICAMLDELGELPLLVLAREVIYSHHEWWNGSGYPFKLAGETIPLAARIVALADVYDALTTPRPYKTALTHQRAREIILSGMGTQFDPMMVACFLLREKDFERISHELSRGDQEKSTSPPEIEPIYDVESLQKVRR
ncbi:MAG: hypothetical protein HJJLKODD_02864 [Phycisphaerae bacterium]|nr:hypothetical protein [Phycisphaerae bacterium]